MKKPARKLVCICKRRKAACNVQKKTWQLPTLPRTSRSTIGVRAFYFRVREGNGYFHPAMATRRSCSKSIARHTHDPFGTGTVIWSSLTAN